MAINVPINIDRGPNNGPNTRPYTGDRATASFILAPGIP